MFSPVQLRGCSSGAIRGAAARTGLVCRFSLVIEKNTGSVTPEPSFALHPTASIKCQRARERVLLALCPMYAVAVCSLCFASPIEAELRHGYTNAFTSLS